MLHHFTHCGHRDKLFGAYLKNKKILAKEIATFCFRCATFLCEIIILCTIIQKLHFAQNCAILLLRYYVLRNTENQDVHTLAQKSSSILPTTSFKLKLKTDTCLSLEKKDLRFVR